jgi:hypothetical protein
MGEERPSDGPTDGGAAGPTQEASDELAAEEAVEPDRLLPGEDPPTANLEDALHWVQVYDELLSFKWTLIVTTREQMEAMGETTQEEVGRTDLRVLEAEKRRLERRLSLWSARVLELRVEGS